MNLRKISRRFLALAIAIVLSTGLYLAFSVQPTDPTQPSAAKPHSRPCAEDDPCWNCATMGNRLCAPIPAFVEAVPAPTSTTTPVPITPPPAPTTADRCAENLAIVEASGLYPAPEFEFFCPAPAYTAGRDHWGMVAWGGLLQPNGCPDTRDPLRGCYIEVNPARVGPSDARLQYTIAHEICHSILESTPQRDTSEAHADQCAAAHGFPRV